MTAAKAEKICATPELSADAAVTAVEPSPQAMTELSSLTAAKAAFVEKS